MRIWRIRRVMEGFLILTLEVFAVSDKRRVHGSVCSVLSKRTEPVYRVSKCIQVPLNGEIPSHCQHLISSVVIRGLLFAKSWIKSSSMPEGSSKAKFIV